MQQTSIQEDNESLPYESTPAADDLTEFIKRHPRLFVLTGAGISHASGIPTYRDESGRWQRYDPIQHHDFMTRESSRKKYWARSYAGWPTISEAQPNVSHHALAKMGAQGFVAYLITQNIDRLHQKAGHENVIDLHGRLDQVVCMDCGAISQREDLQQRLAELNPQLPAIGELAPDGDADVPDDVVAGVNVPSCQRCDGMLKPNVVFFGDSVNRDLVSQSYDALGSAEGVLVIGSSLMVYTGYRYCRSAHELGIPIACINKGLTRADDLFELKVTEDCGKILSYLADSLHPNQQR